MRRRVGLEESADIANRVCQREILLLVLMTSVVHAVARQRGWALPRNAGCIHDLETN
jgi:hypothetical protein